MSARLTVVIPTWNRCHLLEKCLLSLDCQTVAAEIVVVDNGSDDGTVAMLAEKFPHVRCLRLSQNLGFAKAVNRGIQAADTPFVALLNNDTEAAADWVERVLEAFDKHPDYDFFASQMRQSEFPDFLDSAGDCYDRYGMAKKRGYGQPASQFDREQPVPAASGGASFYRRSLFDDAGYFDEDFYMYLEDVEFSLRCQLLKHRCLYVPAARVLHLEAGSDEDRPQGSRGRREAARTPVYTRDRVFWITRNRFLLMLLYQPFRHAPFLAFAWTRSFGFHLLKAGFLTAFLRGLFSGASALPGTLRKRRRLKHLQRISEGELCRLLRQC